MIVSAEAHSTVFKALQMLGLGRNRVVKIPTDSQGRMQASSLPSLDANTLVCVQAGNVNFGAFDDIAGICAKAKETGAWVHVDGAFGMWAQVSPKLKHLTEGLSKQTHGLLMVTNGSTRLMTAALLLLKTLRHTARPLCSLMRPIYNLEKRMHVNPSSTPQKPHDVLEGLKFGRQLKN